jgi:transketolase N-terminal domain/subunit
LDKDYQLAAQAKKIKWDNQIIYTLHGDGGELQEGQNWKPSCTRLPKKVDISQRSI